MARDIPAAERHGDDGKPRRSRRRIAPALSSDPSPLEAALFVGAATEPPALPEQGFSPLGEGLEPARGER